MQRSLLTEKVQDIWTQALPLPYYQLEIHLAESREKVRIEELAPQKTGFFGNFSQMSDPPSPPFGNPCFPIFFLFFCILGPQEHFWSSQKCPLFGQFYFSKVLGIGDPPKNSLFLLLGIRDPPKTSMFRHTKNETVKIKQFWELQSPPPPFGKNSQKIPFYFLGSVPNYHFSD